MTPHPRSASCSSARSVSTATTEASCTTIASAKVPQPHSAGARRPSDSSKRGWDDTTDFSSQWFDIPLTHHQHVPHAGETDASTRSPTLTRRTSAPTSSTIPQPS